MRVNKTQPPDEIAALVHEVNDLFGECTLVRASEVEDFPLEAIPTGIYALDFCTGGGIPKRKVSEFNGKFSAFKTTAALMTMANHLKGPNTLGIICDAEHAFNTSIGYAKKLGVDTTRLLILDPDTGEQACEVLKKVLDRDFDIFAIVDSIAALTPASELEKSAEDSQQPGGNAKFITRMLAMLNARIKRGLYNRNVKATTVLALNQERNKIGVMFGSPITHPGGLAREHYMGLMVHFHSSPAKVESKDEERNGVKRALARSQLISFEVKKNKINGIYGEGDFEFMKLPCNGYRQFTVNNADALMHYGIFYGVIRRNKNTLIWQGIRAIGEKKFRTLLQDEGTGVQDAIYKEILDAILKEALGES